ncbi:MAG: glutamyl-tRNA reductase [Pyrinomonadaceae bacterium]|nr:glutamyl-tRNA reductase [Pyrinomonadaceae bacterium]
MSLFLIGLNHKTAPLAVREKLAFAETDCALALTDLVDGEIVREAFLLSTCNRVEILVEADANHALPRIVEFLANEKNLPAPFFDKHLYSFSDEEVPRHLFRVAASLDSMLVGESQILGQVRKAYQIAVESKTVGRNLHKLLHHAFHAAKRVRTETKIAHNAVSLSYAAVESARKLFGELTEKTVLLIGAGEMAELAAKHLVQNGANKLLIVNRTFENAVKLADEFSAEAVELERLIDILPNADIVICSTAANDFLLDVEDVRKSQTIRDGKPTLFVDLSVPRNLEPRLNELENVYLLDVDDLQNTITANLREREREAEIAETIIESEVQEFQKSLQTLDIGQMLGTLRQKMHDTARNELDKNRAKLGELTPEQEIVIEKILLATVNKVSHPILYGLRQTHEHGDKIEAAQFAEILCDSLKNTVANNDKS